MWQKLTAALLLAGGTIAAAQDLPTDQRAESIGGLRALNTADAAQAWQAVGRLDTGASFCSATLIAPDLVLTAAHCLYHPSTDRRFAPGDLTFSAGLRHGRAEAVRSVRRTVELPGYDATEGAAIEMIARDLALLELQHPIGEASIAAIPTGQAGSGRDAVTVVSYGAERAAHASIEEDCAILARSGPVRSLSCEVVSGASGSPVLRVEEGLVEVVAVMSARGTVDGEAISLAVTLDGHMATLMEQRNQQSPFAQSGGSLTFIGTGDSVGDGDRDRLGAHFLRP